MPSAKKRKQQKQEDFKKKKLKVGKKKALPDNYTDTSFKSKSISLPNQSVTEDKSKQATTSRNLTLSDLLSQVRHYNAGVRKEAIAGLREWALQYPGLLVSNLGTIVNGIVKLFVDDDRDVRKALLPFLQEEIATLRKSDLDPFLPIMIMYTCSAMTHIFEDVRNDAVKIMDLWVKVAPDIIKSKFWDKIVGIYSSLLTIDSNEVNTSSKSNGLTLKTVGKSGGSTMKAMIAKSHLHLHKTRLDLLTSLSNFLETGLTTSRRDRMWFLLDSLKNQNAKKAYKERLRRYYKDETAKTVSWNPEDPTSVYFPHPEIASHVTYLASSEISQLSLFESSGPQSAEKALKDEEKTSDTHPLVLLGTFQSILVNSWLETAPSVFTASSIMTLTPALELLHIVVRLTLILCRALVNEDDTSDKDYSWLDKHLLNLLKHYMTYFPYGADTLGDRPAEVDSLLREMNAAVCELTSIYMLEKSAQSQNAIQYPPWTKKMINYVLNSIGYQDGKEGVTSLSWQFKEDDLVSLLPAIWGFLNSLEDSGRYKLFKAFMDFYNFASPNSGVKHTALQFLIRVYLLESTPSYNAEFSVRSSPKYTQLLQKWFSSLPKTLWQMKTQYLHVSRLILNFLCDVARENDKSVFSDETLRGTELAMVPFFFVQMPNKGPMYGPFINLPVDLQQRALEFIYYIASGSQKVRDAISACQEHIDVSVKVVL